VLAETLASLAGRHDDLLDGRFDAILDEWRAAPPKPRRRVSWTTPSGHAKRRNGRHRSMRGHFLVKSAAGSSARVVIWP
jgi:hypothetical protein